MKLNKNMFLPSLLIVILSFLIGFVASVYLPDIMVTHWNIYGQADGYSAKNWGVFLLPMIMIVLLPLFYLLPGTDPYKKNFSKFSDYYYQFLIVVYLFLFYIYALILLYNLRINFNFVQFLIPGFSGLFYFTGVLLQVAQPNWFVGVRTPWTLSNEDVWYRTHKLASRLFKLTAIISLIGVAIPKYGLFFVLAPIIIVSLVVFFYSYFIFRSISKYNKA